MSVNVSGVKYPAQHIESRDSSNVKLEVTEAELAPYRPRLNGTTLNIVLGFVAGTGFTLFGYVCQYTQVQTANRLLSYSYDQGVMSALLTEPSFESVFPQVVTSDAHPNHATLQSFVVAIYVSRADLAYYYILTWNILPQEIGCLIGALSNLWVGDKLGRRHTIVLGGCIMIIGMYQSALSIIMQTSDMLSICICTTLGAILQTASISYAMLVVARTITGIGNGLNVCPARYMSMNINISANFICRPQRFLRITPSVFQPLNVGLLSCSKAVLSLWGSCSRM